MNNDLRARLRNTRRVTAPWSDDATRGVTAGRLDEVLERWADGYEWAEHERRIAELPWTTVHAGGVDLRLIHQPAAASAPAADHAAGRSGNRAAADYAAGASAPAPAAAHAAGGSGDRADADVPVVVLLHGWPDSVLRFERVLPLLTDVHVVVPALPGFPFAAPLTERGMSAARMAGIIAQALPRLGYRRYTLSGGDIGGAVAELIAAEHPENVASLHLTNVAPQRALTADPANLAPDAAAYLARAAQWFRTEGGYIAEQSTRPGTLAVALGDSPAGLAAWLTEKLDSWSDAGAFTIDEFLTWISAYWETGTIGTSFAAYTEPATFPSGRIETPTVLSVFAHDIKPEPRSYAEAFLNVLDYREHPAGGHFAAWEQPEAYVSDLRRAVELGGCEKPSGDVFVASVQG